MKKSCENCRDLKLCNEIIDEYNNDYGTSFKPMMFKNIDGLLEDCWEEHK